MPIRSGALLHVHNDPVRSVVIAYEFALNYCPDYDMGDHDLATIGPNRHINSQADSIHLLPELLQFHFIFHLFLFLVRGPDVCSSYFFFFCHCLSSHF